MIMFSLTQEERRVILFLACVALIGMATDFLVKKYSPLKSLSSLTQDIGKVNLNTADKELLMSVSGIGEKLGARIIEYRQKQGRFFQVEELKNIKGITNYKYEKIRDSFIVK